MIRSGTRVITEDGRRGKVLWIDDDIARVDFDQSEKWGRHSDDVSLDELYREDESDELTKQARGNS